MPQLLPYSKLHSYLCGFDQLTGAVMGFPFQDAKPEPVSGAAGATTSTEFNKVESYESLTESLSVDSRAEARFGLFGADASLSVDMSSSMNRYSIYLYALAKIDLAFQQVQNIVYKPEVLELLKQPGGSAAFRKAYGDRFIRGIASGGQLLSIIDIRTKTEDVKKDVDAALSGSYGFAVSGDLKLESKLATRQEDTFIRVVRYQVGGTPVTIEKPEDVIPQVQAWVKELETNAGKAVPYQVGLVSYDTVPVPGVDWLDASIAEQNLDTLAVSRKTYQTNLNDVMYVLTNQDEFTWDGWKSDDGSITDPDSWVANLDEWSKKLKANIADTEKKAREIAKDLTTPLTEWNPVPLTDLKLPPRKVSSAPAETPPPEGANPLVWTGFTVTPVLLEAAGVPPPVSSGQGGGGATVRDHRS